MAAEASRMPTVDLKLVNGAEETRQTLLADSTYASRNDLFQVSYKKGVLQVSNGTSGAMIMKVNVAAAEGKSRVGVEVDFKNIPHVALPSTGGAKRKKEDTNSEKPEKKAKKAKLAETTETKAAV